MSDLFSPLRTPSAEPLPASPAQIRDRGDRARRRRTALLGAGAAAAVAAVASGVLLLGPEPATEIQPAPPAPSTPEQSEPPADPDTIPADFPLAEGMVEGETTHDDPWLADIDYCNTSSSMSDTAIDDRFAASLMPGVNQFRSLELFPSAREARARALDHVEQFRSCPAYTTSVGSVAHTQVTDSGIGDQGWSVTRDFMNDGEPQFGQEVYQVVRSGPLLLVTKHVNEGPGSTDPEAFRMFALQDRESTMDVVQAMCPWSEASCVGG